MEMLDFRLGKAIRRVFGRVSAVLRVDVGHRPAGILSHVFI